MVTTLCISTPSGFGNYEALKAMTSVAGDLAALTGQNNPYPGKLGIIEPGAYADIILVDGNPLDDMSVLGADPQLFEAESRGETIETIGFIMKDGRLSDAGAKTEEFACQISPSENSGGLNVRFRDGKRTFRTYAYAGI